MGLRLVCPSIQDFERARIWRNKMPGVLRTPYLLTKEQQEHFYQNVVCDRNSRLRFWSLRNDNNSLIGLAGLINIEWENGLAEISLIFDPDCIGKGYGPHAVQLLLAEGFNNLGLATIYGECYECNPAVGFWEHMVEKYGGYSTKLPRRKRWEGKLYDSLYFSFCME